MAGGQSEAAWSFGMTDLQEALTGRDGEAARREALACLESSLARIDARLLAGLDQRQMTQARVIRDALDTARGVLTDARHASFTTQQEG